MFRPKKNEELKKKSEISGSWKKEEGVSFDDVEDMSSNLAAAKEDVSEPCSDLRRSSEAMFQPKRRGKD